jgi:hypothetical protein
MNELGQASMNKDNVINFEKVQFINSLPKNVSDTYKKIAKLENGNVSYHLFLFCSFCHAYAKNLLNYGQYTEYGNFITKFNELVVKDETYQHMKKVQNQLPFVNRFFEIGCENILIKDYRYSLKNEKFENENDLEEVIYQAFKDYFSDELTVKRQQVVGYGKSDILINNQIAIELKKDKAKRKDVYQTFEYSFDEKINTVCLITAGFDEKVLSIAEKLNVDCYAYSLVRFSDELKYPEGIYIEKVTNSKQNIFDQLLSEIDGGVIYFSHYDPSFSFSKEFKVCFSMLEKLFENTTKYVKRMVQDALRIAEEKGLDTSNGLRSALQDLENQEQTGKAI